MKKRLLKLSSLLCLVLVFSLLLSTGKSEAAPTADSLLKKAIKEMERTKSIHYSASRSERNTSSSGSWAWTGMGIATDKLEHLIIFPESGNARNIYQKNNETYTQYGNLKDSWHTQNSDDGTTKLALQKTLRTLTSLKIKSRSETSYTLTGTFKNNKTYKKATIVIDKATGNISSITFTYKKHDVHYDNSTDTYTVLSGTKEYTNIIYANDNVTLPKELK